MKKILSLFACLMMVVGLTACTNAEPADEKKTVNVGVSIYKFDDNFMTLYRQEIEKYFNSKIDCLVFSLAELSLLKFKLIKFVKSSLFAIA